MLNHALNALKRTLCDYLSLKVSALFLNFTDAVQANLRGLTQTGSKGTVNRLGTYLERSRLEVMLYGACCGNAKIDWKRSDLLQSARCRPFVVQMEYEEV